MLMLRQHRRVVDSSRTGKWVLNKRLARVQVSPNADFWPLTLDAMRLAAHVGLLATFFWYRDAYAALYNDASQLPSTTFDFIIVGGMPFF